MFAAAELCLPVHLGTAAPSARLYTCTMMNHTAVVPDAAAEIRWRDWQARGAVSDRQTATRMRNLMLLVLAALVVAFFIQLT